MQSYTLSTTACFTHSNICLTLVSSSHVMFLILIALLDIFFLLLVHSQPLNPNSSSLILPLILFIHEPAILTLHGTIEWSEILCLSLSLCSHYRYISTSLYFPTKSVMFLISIFSFNLYSLPLSTLVYVCTCAWNVCYPLTTPFQHRSVPHTYFHVKLWTRQLYSPS